MARLQGAFRPAEGVDRADEPALARREGEFRGPVLPDRECHDLRQARQSRSDLHRRGGSHRCESGRRGRRWIHLHQRQACRTLSRDAAAERRGGARLRAAGRPSDGLDRMIELKVSFDTDKQKAMADTRYWAALALSAEEKTSVEDPLQMEKLADALPLERAASRWIVSTDPEEQVERIRPYVELGFRHLVFHAPGPDQARFLRLYSERVIPRLRKA